MLSPKRVDALIEYWILSSREKLKTMEGLYDIRRYSDALFFGHLILEKVLKALVVQRTKKEAPYTHNLYDLLRRAKLNVIQKDVKFLAKVNEFNMRTRYPDEKLKFYKICNKVYTDRYYSQIIKLYRELCQYIKQKI